MADIVNLRQARKQRKRDAKEAGASENRIRFGRSKGEKAAEAARREQTARLLDGHRRENGGDADA
ncbi:DUF4169 family protein [Methylopila henanensis]|uniref:DUF4169 family protein n=1 Tax=Methylopila henanensis TaxID=873516 RepID=A0ABW4K3E5_9HYPH